MDASDQWWFRHVRSPSPLKARSIHIDRHFAALLIVILIVFGAPVAAGYSWFPLPFLPHWDVAPAQPAYLLGYDNFTFPHVDWPWRLVAAHEIANNGLPLWNPYASLGIPFAAQYENQLFFPLEWLELWLGLAAWNAVLVVKIIIAAVGAWLLLRRVLSDPQASAVGAAFYAFSPYFIWFQSVTSFVTGAMMTPWVCWAAICLSDKHILATKRVGRLALTIGLLLLSGQPQISFLTILAATIIVVLISTRVLHTIPVLSDITLFSASMALGAGIAAVQLMLSWEMIQHGYSLHSPGSYSHVTQTALNWVLTISPFILGQLMWPWDGRLFPGQMNAEAFPFFIGISGLSLGVAGLVGLLGSNERVSRLPWAFAVLLALGFGVIILETLGIHVWNVSGLNRVNFPRYVAPVLSLALSAMVGSGVVSLSRGISWRPPFIAAVLAMVAIVACLLPILAMAAASPQAIHSEYKWLSVIIGLGVPLLLIAGFVALGVVTQIQPERRQNLAGAIGLWLLAEMTFLVRYGFPMELEIWRIGVLGALCCCAVAYLLGFRRSAFAMAALALCLPQVLLASRGPEGRLPDQLNVFATPPPYYQFLQTAVGRSGNGGRVLSTKSVLIPDLGSAWGIPELQSLNPQQVETTADYIFTLLSTGDVDYTTPNAWPGVENVRSGNYPSWEDYAARRRFYNLLAVRWLVCPKDNCWLATHELVGLRPAYRDSVLRIFEDTQALPRAFAASAITP